MLADESKNGLFYVWPQRFDRIEGKRKTASIVGVQISNRRMRAMSGERHGEPTGSDGKDDVQKSVERMRCVALRSGLADAFAIELAAAVSIAAECVAIRRASEARAGSAMQRERLALRRSSPLARCAHGRRFQ